MDTHLQHRVIVVTGASNGFGRIICQKAAALGARVVGADVDAAGLEAAIAEIRAAGGEAIGVPTDVTDHDQMMALGQAAVAEYGAIDVWVNNAGIMPLAFFSDHDRAWQSWHRCLDINVKGVVNGIAAAYDQMMAQGRGHVINISSIYGNAGIVGSGVYSASKAAVNAVSESLRNETKGVIKVTVVRPTGVMGTNLASGVVNDAGLLGLTGARAQNFIEVGTALAQGTLDPELAHPDNPQYWMLKPEELADMVIWAMDQPWGVLVSDLTIRATGDDYVY